MVFCLFSVLLLFMVVVLLFCVLFDFVGFLCCLRVVVFRVFLFQCCCFVVVFCLLSVLLFACRRLVVMLCCSLWHGLLFWLSLLSNACFLWCCFACFAVCSRLMYVLLFLLFVVLLVCVVLVAVCVVLGRFMRCYVRVCCCSCMFEVWSLFCVDVLFVFWSDGFVYLSCLFVFLFSDMFLVLRVVVSCLCSGCCCFAFLGGVRRVPRFAVIVCLLLFSLCYVLMRVVCLLSLLIVSWFVCCLLFLFNFWFVVVAVIFVSCMVRVCLFSVF